MVSTTPDTGDGVNYAPVNVAPPNWQCPHCLHKYHSNLEAATECAQAGPPAPVIDGTPVLIIAGCAQGSVPKFGLTKVGPIKPVRVDGVRSHRRDVVVDKEELNPERLAAATETTDGLLIVTDRRETRTETPIHVELSFGVLNRLFKGTVGYYDRGARLPVWISAPYRGEEVEWSTAPDEQQRAALNVVTAGLLDKVAELDEEPLTAMVRNSYTDGLRPRGNGVLGLTGAAAGLGLADAHGSPNHIWSLRWLTAHLDEVVAWQVATLRTWAAGDGGALPAVRIRPPESLPKNPGKRRLAAMEPYGEDYHNVADAVLAELRTETPRNPIPGVGTVEETLRVTHERN